MITTNYIPESFKIPLETAQDIAFRCRLGDYKFITEERVGEHRWTADILIVFERASDGKIFGFIYQRGLTEDCDDSWEEDVDGNVAVYEMKEVEKTVVSYEFIR